MPEPSTEHGAASRERLLEVAIELFARDGYAGTPVSAICKAAGVAPTALYWHFESKAGLLAATLERANATWTERIYKSALEPSDVGERLERLVAGMRELVEQQSDAVALVLMACLQSSQLGPEVAEAADRIQAHAQSYLVRGLTEAVGRRAPDFDLVATTALSLLYGIALEHRRRPESTDLDRLFAHAKETIALAALRALQNDPALSHGGTE